MNNKNKIIIIIIIINFNPSPARKASKRNAVTGRDYGTLFGGTNWYREDPAKLPCPQHTKSRCGFKNENDPTEDLRFPARDLSGRLLGRMR